MDHKKDQEFEQTLAESRVFAARRGPQRVGRRGPDAREHSGGVRLPGGRRRSRRRAGGRRGARAAAAVRIGKTAAPAAEPPEPQPSAPPEEASSATPAQDTVSLQEVLESTVQSVLDEEAEEPIELLPPKRRGLFSRRRLRDTERLYSDEPGEEPPQEEPDEPEDFFTEDFGERDDTPEPDAGELAAGYRDDARMGLRSAQAALARHRALVARAAARPFRRHARAVRRGKATQLPAVLHCRASCLRPRTRRVRLRLRAAPREDSHL